MNEREAIYCHLLKCSRSELYLEKRVKDLSIIQKLRLKNILWKRSHGEPLQYILGSCDFMGFNFKVARGVLIPRPETEILVDEAVKEIKSSGIKTPKILDIGTGSGNIAVVLAKILKDAEITAVDISKKALTVARNNAKINKVLDRIVFKHSDLFGSFNGKNEAFDFIISNPPYVALRDYKALPPEVRREPKAALLAKDKGLYFYRQIEKSSRQYLKKGGIIFLEIGINQVPGIKDIFEDKSIWKEIKFIKDYNNIDRVVVVKKK